VLNGIDLVSEASEGNVSGYCNYKSKHAGNAERSFEIYSDYHISDCRTVTIGIVLDGVQLKKGTQYSLGSPGSGKNFGVYFNSDCLQSRADLFTNDSIPFAQVTITKLDTIKHVVGGTFSFFVRGVDGNESQISGGLFDRHYTF
jgi:hypothetical protein